jgi:hypothetical protein
VPLIDPRTGLIDRAWYLFFVSLMDAATIVDDGNLGTDPISLIASYDAALQALAQEVETQPLPTDLSAELIKQIEAAGLEDCCSGLLSQVAEMQKQLEALNLLPPPSLGTVTAVTATAPVVSSGGTAPNISMPAANTSTDGYLTSVDWNTFNNKAPATSGTSILYGNGAGGFSNVTVGTGLSFIAGTLSASAGTAPVTKTADFTVAATETWLINNKSGSTCTVTLPSAATYTGRELTFKNMQAQTLVSASSNVVPIDSTSAGTAILLAVVGNWATMVSDGTNWVIMQQAANNCLLLE